MVLPLCQKGYPPILLPAFLLLALSDLETGFPCKVILPGIMASTWVSLPFSAAAFFVVKLVSLFPCSWLACPGWWSSAVYQCQRLGVQSRRQASSIHPNQDIPSGHQVVLLLDGSLKVAWSVYASACYALLASDFLIARHPVILLSFIDCQQPQPMPSFY